MFRTYCGVVIALDERNRNEWKCRRPAHIGKILTDSILIHSVFSKPTPGSSLMLTDFQVVAITRTPSVDSRLHNKSPLKIRCVPWTLHTCSQRQSRPSC